MSDTYIPQGDPTYFLSSFLWSVVSILLFFLIFYIVLKPVIRNLDQFYETIDHLRNQHPVIVRERDTINQKLKEVKSKLIDLSARQHYIKTQGAKNQFLEYKINREIESETEIKASILRMNPEQVLEEALNKLN